MSTEQPSCVQPRPLKEPHDSAVPMHEPSGSRACTALPRRNALSSLHTDALVQATAITANRSTPPPAIVPFMLSRSSAL